MLFNKSLLAIALLAIAGSAFAAPVANLKIDGLVTPPTCTVNGAEQGELVTDFGAVSPSWLNRTGTGTTGAKALPAQVLPLTVTCDASTYLTFILTDTYQSANKEISALPFSSALVANNNKSISVGYNSYTMFNMAVDGKKAYFGRVYSAYGNTTILPGTVTGWTSESQVGGASTSTLKLVAGKVFTTDLTVSATLWSRERIAASGINLSEQVDYIGESVMAFSFGV